ncbi:MAG TPA: NADH-quinone oxidoreductase subunit A [Acidobacteriota bacterium]|nr:NADH-quinone oxidoreductase subunit A [Acidobacteriota bacterium]
MDNLVAVSLMALVVAALAVLIIFLKSILGPKSTSPLKEQPFETGEAPFAIVKSRIPIHFYLVALLFVLFDVELVFLFPWAIVMREIGWRAFIAMALFMGLLFETLVYAWKKGVLSWK